MTIHREHSQNKRSERLVLPSWIFPITHCADNILLCAQCRDSGDKLVYIFLKCLFTGLPRSMPNADQCRSKSWHWSEMPLNANHCRSMPINSDQFLSMPINANLALIGIERNWEELIGIDRHWSELIDIGINARILIGIDRHWALIAGVLLFIIGHQCATLSESNFMIYWIIICRSFFHISANWGSNLQLKSLQQLVVFLEYSVKNWDACLKTHFSVSKGIKNTFKHLKTCILKHIRVFQNTWWCFFSSWKMCFYSVFFFLKKTHFLW